jgi:hypothetical protein
MKYFFQKILIFTLNFLFPILNTKLVLFSRFMSKKNCSHLLTQWKINKCLYIVNGQDLAIGRRIYTGMDDEHL